MAKKIYLSPSNQNGNLYAYGNTNECDQCNRIADTAKKALERCGFTVKKAPKGQDMNKSIKESNLWGADLHLPIHTNAGGGAGTMCMVYSKASENMKFANPIYKEVQAVTPGKTEYGIREYPQLAELNGTNCIAVYTEVDFHDNPTIAKWLIDNPTKVGEAICKGVCKAYGVTYKSTANTTSAAKMSGITNSQANTSTASDRDKVLNTARSYIGKTGYDICITKLKLGMIVDWCAYSISAIMQECGFIKKYQGGIYGFASDAAREDHGKYGAWLKKGEKTPQPGDYIMFKYASFTNPIDKYSASHVGLVEAVNGNVLTTLEGNVDGRSDNWAATSTYKRKTRYLSSSDVYSFYRPYWKNVTPAPTPTPTPKKKTVDEIAKEVIQGKWGAGEERKKKLKNAGYDYDAVQKRVDELMKPYKIKKGSIVRVRDGAKTYDGKSLASFVFGNNYYVIELVGNRAVIGIGSDVTAAVKVSDLILFK